MGGKHEAPGSGEFWVGLLRQVTLVGLVIAVVVALIFAVWKVLPDWFPTDPIVSTSTLVGLEATTTTTTDAGVQPVRTTSTKAAASGSTLPTSSTTSSSTTTSTTISITTTTVPTPRSPGEITVKVLNSTRIKGLAAGVTADLAAAGYQMKDQDNYRPTLEVSYVYYAPGFQAEAFGVAEFVPGAQVAVNPADPPSADVLVILGADFSG